MEDHIKKLKRLFYSFFSSLVVGISILGYGLENSLEFVVMIGSFLTIISLFVIFAVFVDTCRKVKTKEITD